MIKKEFIHGHVIFSKEQMEHTNTNYFATTNKAKYRYYYQIGFCPKRPLLFIMLNPSVADEDNADTTMRNCIHLALQYGFDGISVVNLYPERDTKFKKWEHCKAHDKNIRIVNKAIKDYSDIVLAWGSTKNDYENKLKFIKGKNYYYIVPKRGPIKNTHPSNMCWNSHYGGFKNATLYKIDYVW